MRKFLMIALAGMLTAGVAQADSNNTGCGWGTMLFEGQSGVAPQIFAVTTNGTFGNQTFGITFGTVGCKKDGVVKAPMAMFTGKNMDRLAREMAVGKGESLETLADLMGIEDQDKAAFYQAARTNFGTVFPSSDVTAAQMLDNLHYVMAQDAQLARYVA